MLSLLKKILLRALQKIAAIYQTVSAIPAYWTYCVHGHQLIHYEAPLSGNIAIFASFQRKPSRALLGHLRDLQGRGYQTIFVSNIPLSPGFIEAISPLVAVCIERPNIARDFGAYKCGMQYFYKHCKDRAVDILLTNDTIFFPLFDSSYFWQQLGKLDGQVIGIFESFGPRYHLQSYFIKVKPEVHSANYFRDYWRKYKLWNSRSHAIGQGELGFSSMLMKNGVKVNCFISVSEISEYIKILCETDLQKWLSLDQSRALHLHENGRSIKDPTNQIYLQRAIGDWLEDSNPSHSFAFQAVILKQVPFLKKDLVSRGSYRLADVLGICSRISADIDLDLLSSEMRQKRLPSEKTLKEKLMERLGMI